jgi:hypothetical protein
LRGRQERRRPPTEIDEVHTPAGDGIKRGVQLPLAAEAIEIRFDFFRIPIGVDAEITKMTPLPAERDVKIDTERHIRDRW